MTPQAGLAEAYEHESMASPSPASPGRRETWGIVGGGMLGLSLARRLAEQGKDVTVIEAADRLGGLASAWELDDVTWDRHYHVTLLSDSWLRGLLGDLGLDREIKWVETRTGCFAEGRIHSVSNTLELLRFPVLRLIDKLRLGATIFYGSRIRNGRRLERVSVADWLIRWSGRRAYERFWRPLLRSKLGDNVDETSAAFIWATIARLYAARRTGLKKEMFGYVPGGYGRVLDELARYLTDHGVRIELDRGVHSVRRRAGRLEVEVEGGEVERFDRVIVTLATPLAAKVCSDLSSVERDRLERIRYQGVLCASLLLKRPLAGYYLTNILDESLPFTGVVEMSALVDKHRHFGNRSLVYLPRYVGSNDELFAADEDEVRGRFLAGLERMYPEFRPDDVTCFRLSRARQVSALPTLNYSDELPSMVTSVPGLFLVNSAQIVNGTLNVNETIGLAENAAATIGGAGA